MSSCTVKCAIVSFALFAGCLSLIVILSISFAAVSDEEICELFYADGSRLLVQHEPGIVFVGPGYEKHCVPKHTLHLRFDSGSGLSRSIRSRTVEGLPVELQVDVEYRFTAEGLTSNGLERTGYKDYSRRLMMTARAEIRNSASQYEAIDFLRGSREDISVDMQQRLTTTLFSSDQVFVEIIRVNLIQVVIDSRFEEKFQEAEDIKLLQLQAQADFNLSVVEQTRLNETEIIFLLAQRDRILQEAMAEVIAARLAQEREITAAKTEGIKSQIQAESARIQQTIKRSTLLDETKANQGLNVQQAKRQVVATMELATTERLNMITEMEGQIRRAHANRTRDLASANVEKTRRLERLHAIRINKMLEIFTEALTANVTAFKVLSEGLVDAEKEFVKLREETDLKLALQSALNLTDTQLASILWHRTLGQQANRTRTVTLDYEKVPFLSEFSGTSKNVLPQIDISN